MSDTIRFNIKLNIDGKDVVVQASESVKELRRNLQATKTSADKTRQSILGMNQITTIFGNINSSLSSLKSSMDTFTGVYNNAVQAETKLVTVMRQRMGANEEMVTSINKVISEQTKLGIVGGTVQKSGAQQIATFLNEASSLNTLIPAMNDLLAQQKGINATSEDAVGIANLMGKAMQGQTSALKRVGITFTNAQAKVMQFGTESQRAAMLAEIITDNVGHMNAALAATDAGKIKQASNELGGMMKRIGAMLSPYQQLINQFAMFGMAVSSVFQVASAFMTFTKALGLTKLAMAGVRAAQASFTAMSTLMSAAINGTTLSLTALRAGIKGTIMSLGLIGIAYVALSGIIETVINKLGLFDSASNNAAGSVEAISAATESAKAQVKDARAELEKNIAVTKNFKGSKDEEKVIVDKLNNTYGDTMGYFSNVHDWYNALIKDSKAYCDQLVIEAENRKLADQAAEIDEKIYDIRYDKNGKPKKYSTAKTTKRTPVLDKNGLQVFDPSGTPLYNYVQTGPSQLDNKNAELNQLRSQRDNIRRRMNGNESRRRNVRMPVRGSDTRPDTVTTSKNTPSRNVKTGHVATTLTSTKTEVFPSGSIAQLNQQIDALRKKRDQLTDPESIANVDNEIRKLTSDIENLNMSAREIGLKRSEKSLGIEEFEPTNLGSFTPTLDDKALSESLDNIKEKWNETFKEMKENAESEAEAIAQAVQSIRSSLGGDVTQTIAEWQELGKCFKQGGDAATGAGGAMVLVGQQMQQIAGDGAAAKVGAIMAAIGQLVLGYATASAQAADLGPFGWIGFAIAGAATLASIISQVSSFSTGGIVGGTSYNGDKVPARVNSGEMILTMRQQKRLFSIANGDIMPKVGLPSYQSVTPSLHTAGSLAAIPLDITIHGKTRGADTLYTLQNVRRRDAKFGKRWD